MLVSRAIVWVGCVENSNSKIRPSLSVSFFFFLLSFVCVRVLLQGYYDDISEIGGPEQVMINPLNPGENQTVTVMQQAPKDVSEQAERSTSHLINSASYFVYIEDILGRISIIRYGRMPVPRGPFLW